MTHMVHNMAYALALDSIDFRLPGGFRDPGDTFEHRS